MRVIFEARIKMRDATDWYVELKDSITNILRECDDMDEFSATIEELGLSYGGEIDEVKWAKDENVPPHIMDEIRLEMSKQQEDIEKSKEK
jgi:hypothetical protein